MREEKNLTPLFERDEDDAQVHFGIISYVAHHPQQKTVHSVTTVPSYHKNLDQSSVRIVEYRPIVSFLLDI